LSEKEVLDVQNLHEIGKIFSSTELNLVLFLY